MLELHKFNCLHSYKSCISSTSPFCAAGRRLYAARRQAGGALVAQLVLSGLDEETAFVEFDVDCYANLILGYDWLHAHNLSPSSTTLTRPVSVQSTAACRVGACTSISRLTSRRRRLCPSQPPTYARSSALPALALTQH